LIYLPVFLDGPGMTNPELQSLVIGEKVRDGFVPYSSLVDATSPLSAWFFGLLDIFFGRSLMARHILALLVLFSQSAFLGMIFINKKAFSESTYIPSFLFSILAFYSFDTLSLSTDLLGSGFLLLALNNLFKEIEFRTQRDETIFNLGLFISLATLCNFSFVIHLLGVIAILVLFTRTSVRSFLLLIFGFLLPHLLMMSIYFLNHNLSQLWQFYYLPNLWVGSGKLLSNYGLFLLALIPLMYLLISLVMLNREARFTKYQSQLLQSMFFWMIFSFIQAAFFSNDLRPQSFITLIPSLVFFITHFLLLIRRKRFAEMNAWILLVGIVAVSYMARYGKIEAIRYEEKLLVGESPFPSVKNKTVLVLGSDFSVYQHNRLATAFLDWDLSREFFEQPDYYQNIIQINKAFKREPPTIIIDKHDLMKPVFDRIPALKAQYKQVGTHLYERITPIGQSKNKVLSN
jgi:hypothetical protein